MAPSMGFVMNLERGLTAESGCEIRLLIRHVDLCDAHLSIAAALMRSRKGPNDGRAVKGLENCKRPENRTSGPKKR